MSLLKKRKAYEQKRIEKTNYINSMYENHHSQLFGYQNYLAQTAIESISITEQKVIFTFKENGIKMYGVEFDERIAPIETLNFLEYEPGETQMMKYLVSPAAVILDIGANAGWNSLVFAKNDLTSRVIAFEPVESTYSVLISNIKLNQLKNVECINYGLSDEQKKIDFYFSPVGSGNASTKNHNNFPQMSKTNCQLRRLDDVALELELDSIDFIKCDVEGAELFVFEGAKESLLKFKPIIFSEMLRKWSANFEYHPNEIIQLLRELNYSCYFESEGSLVEVITVDDDTLATNYFFLHNIKHSSLILKHCSQ